MAEHRALIAPDKQAPLVVKSVPTYRPGPGELLFKVEAAGLAIADYAVHLTGLLVEKWPVILGQDAAGIVEEVGEGVTKFRKGDRVFTQCKFPNNAFGGFQQYALALESYTAKIPPNITSDQAAAIPLALATSAVALYHDPEDAVNGTCGLTPPWEEGGRGKYAGQPAVVFAGASSVGQVTIQLLKLSGFDPIITTASPHNADLLKTTGATHVLDRKLSSDALYAEINKIAFRPIKTIYDAAGTPETQNLGYELLAPGGVLACVRPEQLPAEKLVLEKKAFWMMGSVHHPQNHKFGAGLYAKLSSLLEEGAALRVCLGVSVGLDRVGQGVSGVKLVVHPQPEHTD